MSGEWSTTTNLISGLASTWSKLYDPILGSLARPTPGKIISRWYPFHARLVSETMGKLKFLKFLDKLLKLLNIGMPPMGPPDSINPNKATLASSLQQQTAALTPTELTGMSLNWQTSIGQRMMRTHSFKWVGQGNPMMGKPGSGLEVKNGFRPKLTFLDSTTVDWRGTHGPRTQYPSSFWPFQSQQSSHQGQLYTFLLAKTFF